MASEKRRFIPWAYRLLALFIGIDLILAWQQTLDSGWWTLVFSSGYRLDAVYAIPWLGFRTLAVIVIVVGWRPNLLIMVMAMEIILGFIIASFDISVYWRADCGCLVAGDQAYLQMGLRSLQLGLMLSIRR
jgi:hypothetical protein